MRRTLPPSLRPPSTARPILEERYSPGSKNKRPAEKGSEESAAPYHRSYAGQGALFEETPAREACAFTKCRLNKGEKQWRKQDIHPIEVFAPLLHGKVRRKSFCTWENKKKLFGESVTSKST